MTVKLRNLETVGERLKHLRRKHDVSQSELAKLIGVDRTTIIRYEKNVYEPSLHTIALYSKLFKVSTDYILKGVITENDKKNH